MSVLESQAWDRWFNLQYDVRQKVDEHLEQALRGQPKVMRAAVVAALLEHLAERLRFELDLPETPPAENDASTKEVEQHVPPSPPRRVDPVPAPGSEAPRSASERTEPVNPDRAAGGWLSG